MIHLVFKYFVGILLLFNYLHLILATQAAFLKKQTNENIKSNENNNYDISKILIDFYTLQSTNNLLHPQCARHVKRYFDDLNVAKPWALKMIDASSKLQSGILLGNLVEFGNFDECLAIKNDEDRSDIIMGKYCTLSLIPDNNTIRQILPALKLPPERITNLSVRTTYGITWSVCIPDSCRLQDLQRHYKNMIPKLLNLNGISVVANNGSCYTREDYRVRLRKSDWFMIGILICLLTLIVLSTLYDFVCQTLNVEKTSKMLKYFSMYENTLSLLKVQPSSGGTGTDMRVLNGLRFLSAAWVIIFHRFMLRLFMANINSVDIQQWIRQYHSMIIIGSTVSVDTFFTISGMLVLISFFKTMDKDNTINIPRFYLHRYLRLTPTMALTQFFYATLSKYMLSGPMWLAGINALQGACRTHWWSALLYIQNYVNPEAFCVVQTWYLSVDMQLFWIAPLFLYPLYRKPAFGLSLIFVMIIIPMVISFYLGYINYYHGGIIFQKDILDTHYFHQHYTQTHVRASPWFVGLVLGYIIYKTRNQKVAINPGLVGLLWLATFLILIIVVFGIYPFQQYDYILVRWRSASDLAFSRTAWSLAIAWIIFASVHGYGGPINKFLSCSIFTVMNKLGYGMFLTHLGVQFALAAAMNTPEYFTMFTDVYYCFADIGLAALMSYVLTVGFEMPIFKIEDYFFKKFSNKQVDKKIIDTRN